jgi:hypothetical protein
LGIGDETPVEKKNLRPFLATCTVSGKDVVLWWIVTSWIDFWKWGLIA